MQLIVTCKCNSDKSLKSDILLRSDVLINALNFKFVSILLLFLKILLTVFVSVSNFMCMSIILVLSFLEIFETYWEAYLCDLLPGTYFSRRDGLNDLLRPLPTFAILSAEPL